MFLTGVRREALRPLMARRVLNPFVAQDPRRFSATPFLNSDKNPVGSGDHSMKENQPTSFESELYGVDSDATMSTQTQPQKQPRTPEEHNKRMSPMPWDHITIDSPWSELSEYNARQSFRKNSLVTALWPDHPEYFGGFLTSKRILSSKLAFATVSREAGHHRDIQVIFEDEWLVQVLKKTRLHSAVSLTGLWRPASDGRGQQGAANESAPSRQGEPKKECLATFFRVLNQAPARHLTGEDALPPRERVLQLRFYPELVARLRFRSFLQREFIDVATRKFEYNLITTPTLFKSTPEGAREFLVPARAKGTAYTLTQSPQQYKQALMAAGIRGYMQFAPCWRDEDLRQDRQPEFMQLDMEKSFANRDSMLYELQQIVRHVVDRIGQQFRWQQIKGRGNKQEWVPMRLSEIDREQVSFAYVKIPPKQEVIQAHFNKLEYKNAMLLYGSDKPDLRIAGRICDVTKLVSDDFKQKITNLEDPIIEAWRLNIQHPLDLNLQDWIQKFMEGLPKGFMDNPDGQPVVLASDPRLPLEGFASLGPEGIEPLRTRLDVSTASYLIKNMYSERGFVYEKDPTLPFLVVFQARKRTDPNIAWQGSSTRLGDLRARLFHAAIASGLKKPYNPGNLQWLWVYNFPMFKPEGSDNDPGQGGAAGFSAAHHPFTAPLSWEDMHLLETDPLKAYADSFDLVLNGVEVGGGSRRINNAIVQEAIMRRVLKMSEERVEQFRPLLDALRYAPPHVGFAFGFDRLAAMMSGTSSIRDVVAFPKTMKGEDAWAGSPSQLTDEQLERYHLQRKT